jgi:cyclohexyl-isocyanide hydratase
MSAAPFQIGMLVFPGMTSLDFAGPLDVFARLPDSRVHVLAKTLEPVVTDIGMRELPTLRMRDAPALDLLFIGGGPGVNPLMEDEETLDFFVQRAPRARWITSVCTGALVLGRPACCAATRQPRTGRRWRCCRTSAPNPCTSAWWSTATASPAAE